LPASGAHPVVQSLAFPADMVWVEGRGEVRLDFAIRAVHSDIVTEMAPHPNFYRLPHFGENDPSTEFAPLHRMRWAARIAALFQRQGRHV
jgi:hypothetical protein